MPLIVEFLFKVPADEDVVVGTDDHRPRSAGKRISGTPIASSTHWNATTAEERPVLPGAGRAGRTRR